MRSTYLETDGARKPGGQGQNTPMMEQFWRAKREAPDALLFFRMGDFYELFHEDATVAARELGIALTSRSKGEDAIAMAGVPVRSVDSYLLRLVNKGYRVAICEQMEDPRLAKGIVERQVVRVVTAGTLTEENALDARAANHLACLHVAGARAGLAWVDVSTGRFLAGEIPLETVADEIARVAPAELLVAANFAEAQPAASAEIARALGPRVRAREAWHFDREPAARLLARQLGVARLEGLGLEDASAIVPAAGALLVYLEETQRKGCAHVRTLELVDRARHLVLDRATRACLELFETQREGRREGTLLEVLDQTNTPMGGRTLREWLSAPLRDVDGILHRQKGVAELVEDGLARERLREVLARVLDVERLSGKIATGRCNARDLVGLASSLQRVPELRAALERASSKALGEVHDALDPLAELAERIAGTFVDAPPPTVKDGGLVRAGVSAQIDELHALARDAKGWMARFQGEESARTGMSGLKVGFNSVFGYFLEVPRGQVERVPAHWIRKQTVKNAERYVTPELKEFEEKVLHAEERARDLEFALFEELRAAAAREIPRVLATARAIGELDALAALAQCAVENRWTAPKVDAGDLIKIADGRHPLVERAQRDVAFVPNDSHLNRADRLVTVLTGPNMAGKSTYIRQTALIVLLAQMGSFVPAREAKVGVVDRIFTRIGSADDIGRQASTFMVEMLEIANILNNATARSLVVLDEVGRGTSTFDGLALAWAIAEHLHERTRCRTLFATHYHQLTQLAMRFEGVCNKSVAVREWNDEIVFLHKIVEGGTDRSYGIHVARLAGVPEPLVARAREILRELEEDAEGLAPRIARGQRPPGEVGRQLGLFEAPFSAAEEEIRKLDIDRLTPFEALCLLRDLQRKLL
jgi:DNA mismatch repair protein MutS